MILVERKIAKMADLKDGIDLTYEWVDAFGSNVHKRELSTFREINVFGHLAGRDYQFVRDELKARVVAAGGFSSLSDADKHTAVVYSLCTKAEALTCCSSDKRKAYNKDVIAKTKESRIRRVELARQVIGDMLLDGTMSYTDSADLLIDTEALFERYINGGTTELVDWLSGNKFEVKTYYSVGLKDELLNIIVNGAI